MPTILIADDNEKIINMLRRTLIYEGYDVVEAVDGPTTLSKAREHRPDMIVLDWLMPGLDGIEIARRISRADSTPILMLTAKDEVEDRVQGLDSGADDYLVKPFAPDELLARIRALLRRKEKADRDDERPLTYTDLHLDPVTRKIRRGEREFNLSPREFDLLRYFLRFPQRVLPREQIMQAVWEYDFDGNDNVLEVYVGHLRTKTEASGEARLIHTVRGVGYVLRDN